jgi:orotidine-5'-phosphate decarboxylase
VKNRLIVALDTHSVDQARDIVDRLDGTVSFFKIGLRLAFMPKLDGLIDSLVASGKKVFLDTKMYDIPETVAEAVHVASERGMTFVTVHGDDAIMHAANRHKGSVKVFAVTVLTSMDDQSLHEMGYRYTAQEMVEKRALAAYQCGCDGIIASASDHPDQIRRLIGAEGLLVATPGVRASGASLNDHRRPATPEQAIERGADYIVVGRPIVQASDPAKEAQRYIDLMNEGRLNRD